MKAGSLPWLLRNELRLWWRNLTGTKHFWALVGIVGFSALFLLLVLWIALSPVRTIVSETEWSESSIWVALVVWLFAFLFALNGAISQSIIVLFERGDLDLLLSSPIASQTIFAARLISVALTVFFGFSLLSVPASILAVLLGVPQLLGIFPALMGICLVAASLGMLLTLGMVRIMGVRRARTWVQILNTIVALILVLLFQLPNFLLHNTNTDLTGILERVQPWFEADRLLSAKSWIWFPVRAMFSHPGSIALTFGVSSAIVIFTVYLLNQAFVRGTQQSVTRRRRARAAEGTTLKDGFNRVVLAKEWRIMWRNPFLISQVALQILLILPLTWVILQGRMINGGLDVGGVASFAAPFLGGQLSATFTYVCLSGEEAADLLKSAPVPKNSMRRLKQLAALIPIGLLFLPIFVILVVQGQAWFPAWFATLGAMIMTSFIRLWNSRPVAPGELFKRQDAGQMDVLLLFVEQASLWGWAWLGMLLYSGSGFGALILLGILGALFALGQWRGRQLGSLLAF